MVLEVNPRASRTVPFVSKCIGVSLAKVAARCMAGRPGGAAVHDRNRADYVHVKEIGVPVLRSSRAWIPFSVRR